MGLKVNVKEKKGESGGKEEEKEEGGRKEVGDVVEGFR